MPVLVALPALCVLAAPVPPMPADAFAAFQVLKGAWASEPDATGMTGTFTLEAALDGQVLVRRNTTQVPAREGRPAATHQDLMVVYREGDRCKADYWDNERHLIRYQVESLDGRLQLTSSGPGPRFRLTYVLLSPDLVEIRFEMASPDTPGAFRPYLAGRARRVH